MKKLTLFLALMLLLSACAAPAEPSPEPTPTPAPSFAQPSGIYADWSRLEKPSVPENVGSRLSEGPLTELTPAGDYGLLLPYVGGRLESGEFGYWQYQYGLVTRSGCVVLDPVLSSAIVLSDGERYVLLLGKTQELDGRTEQTYALCAPDGSWCTDFLYSDIFAMPDGRLCLCDIRYDENGQYTGDLNNACIMDYDGSVTLNLSEIRPEIPLGDIQASPDFQYSMLGMSEGYARVDLEEGRSVFMDSTGKLLRSDEFDGYFATAFSFSGGVACVQKNWGGPWGLIDRDGRWVLPPEYADMSLNEGLIVATAADGRKLLLDARGQELADLSALNSPSAYPLEKGCLILDWDKEGNMRGYDLQLHDLGLTDYPSVQNGTAVFRIDRDGQPGFVIYDGESQIILDGRYTFVQEMEGVVTAQTAGGQGELLDQSGRLLVSLESCPYGVSALRDRATGQVYLSSWTETGMCLKSTEGKTVFCPGGMIGSLIDGCYILVDETGSAIMDLEGNCIFRTSIDFTD